MPNQYKNKVVYNGNTLIDLTSDTVTASALASGYTAHDASGAAIVGTMESGSMVIRDEEDSHGGTIRHITAGAVVQGTKNITSNGTHDVASYADAYVNVPAPAPNLQVKTGVSPSTSSQTVTADSGYDGLSSVQINAMPSGSAATPATTVTANPSISVNSSTGLITATASATKSVTPTVSAGYVSSGTAGTITVSGSNTSQLSTQAAKTVTPTESSQTAVAAGKYTTGAVTVGAISSTYVGSGITQRSSSDLTESGATVTAPAGYYASSASKSVSAMTLPTSASSTSSGTSKATVGRSTSDQYINIPTGYNSTASYYKVSAVANGTEGTPTATKGAVSNHAVSVTPSVTNSAGYITGSTKTGTAVTVSASELVSGTKSITANGTNIDVTDYAAVDVSVSAQSGMSETDLKNYIQRSSDFTDIDWPDGLERIGGYAFYICGSFNPSSLPSTVTGIDGHAFYGCTSLALTSLPSGLTSVGAYAFYNCTSLALTSLPSGLTSAGVGNYAFSGCTSLALTSLPSGWTEIPTYAFRDCTSLALTSLPSGLTSVGAYAFYNCTSLALTSLPSGLTSVGTYAFSRCTGITTISYVGTTLTTLSASSFLGSSDYSMQLRSASFPNMALTSNISTVFGSTTAANACQFLEFCDIGSTVGIAANAFANCYALETLVLRKSTVCTLANVSAFLNTPMRGYNSKTGTVYVPSSLISSYQTATNWSTLYSAGTVTFSAIEGSDYELE